MAQLLAKNANSDLTFLEPHNLAKFAMSGYLGSGYRNVIFCNQGLCQGRGCCHWCRHESEMRTASQLAMLSLMKWLKLLAFDYPVPDKLQTNTMLMEQTYQAFKRSLESWNLFWSGWEPLSFDYMTIDRRLRGSADGLSLGMKFCFRFRRVPISGIVWDYWGPELSQQIVIGLNGGVAYQNGQLMFERHQRISRVIKPF